MPEEPAKLSEMKIEGDRNRKYNYSLIFTFLGIIVLSLFIINFETFKPAKSEPICSRLCHFTQPEFKSWLNSSHAGLSCYECHIEDFNVGFSLTKITTTFDRIKLTLQDSFDRPLNADSHYSLYKSPNERCLKCHSVKTRHITPEFGLEMSADAIQKHLEAGMTCAMCHNRVAHPSTEQFEPIQAWKKRAGYKNFVYKNFMDMQEGCWRCHSNDKAYRDKTALSLIKNGKKAPTACRTCHNSDFLKTVPVKSGGGYKL